MLTSAVPTPAYQRARRPPPLPQAAPTRAVPPPLPKPAAPLAAPPSLPALVAPIARKEIDDIPDFLDGAARRRRARWIVLAIAALALLATTAAAIASHYRPN